MPQLNGVLNAQVARDIEYRNRRFAAMSPPERAIEIARHMIMEMWINPIGEDGELGDVVDMSHASYLTPAGEDWNYAQDMVEVVARNMNGAPSCDACGIGLAHITALILGQATCAVRDSDGPVDITGGLFAHFEFRDVYIMELMWENGSHAALINAAHSIVTGEKFAAKAQRVLDRDIPAAERWIDRAPHADLPYCAAAFDRRRNTRSRDRLSRFLLNLIENGGRSNFSDLRWATATQQDVEDTCNEMTFGPSGRRKPKGLRSLLAPIKKRLTT